MSIVAAALVWILVLSIGFAGWPYFDWIGKAIIGWVILLSAAGTVFFVTMWRSLYLIADATEIRFGKRVLLRSDVSEIGTGPVATTAVQFWIGVVVMATAQDVTRRVYVRAADGHPLLEIPDLYGSGPLARLAAYLGIPFVDSHRPQTH